MSWPVILMTSTCPRVSGETGHQPSWSGKHGFVRNAYRCSKTPTGPLDHHGLVSYIKQESISSPDKEDQVPFEAGVKRGKVFVPTLTKEEEAALQKRAEIAEKVKLEPDEEEALASASLKDVMALADILNTNPQNFIMEAYAEDLNHYEPDPPNVTNPGEVLDKLNSDDEGLKDVNLNNVSHIEEKQVCDIFDSLRKNRNLTRLSVVNCDINDFAVTTLILALEGNNSLTSLNLEGNKISPDTLASLFESLAKYPNNILELRLAGQQQEKMGFRVESRIADAICRNPRLTKIGMKFEFKDVLNRVSRHLIRNMDALRKKRRGIQEEGQESQMQNGKPSVSEITATEESPETSQEKDAENEAEILKDNVDIVED